MLASAGTHPGKKVCVHGEQRRRISRWRKEGTAKQTAVEDIGKRLVGSQAAVRQAIADQRCNMLEAESRHGLYYKALIVPLTH